MSSDNDILSKTRHALDLANEEVEEEIRRAADLILPELLERRDSFREEVRKVEEEIDRGVRRTKHRISL